ncbi:MAG TPA: ABC transporter ATP-binding protein [Bdellovibrionales bacterium]|nr:ABC transporter ATP-binding protein [Bdellovibrionales bacterium]
MALEVRGVYKRFTNPPTTVLHGIDLTIKDGEFVTIVGRSGSGKTTLLYILSTLDQPTEGTLLINGTDPNTLSVEELHRFRNENIGYVFQFHYLLPELTALENVLLPARKTDSHVKRTPYALELLEAFGLKDKINRYPGQLSGGEQQRVAIARALIMNPRYIFADEPTGNLDTANGQSVMSLLTKINRETGSTLVLVTHEPEYAALAQREIRIVDGRIPRTEVESSVKI